MGHLRNRLTHPWVKWGRNRPIHGSPVRGSLERRHTRRAEPNAATGFPLLRALLAAARPVNQIQP